MKVKVFEHQDIKGKSLKYIKISSEDDKIDVFVNIGDKNYEALKQIEEYEIPKPGTNKKNQVGDSK